MRTMLALGIAEALMAAASRWCMPAKRALTGARTASSSGVAACRGRETRTNEEIAAAKRIECRRTDAVMDFVMALDCRPLWRKAGLEKISGSTKIFVDTYEMLRILSLSL